MADFKRTARIETPNSIEREEERAPSNTVIIENDYVEPPLQVSPQVRVKDPLSETTRKERRSLLGISAVGIVIVRIGLIPEKISALGIEFTTHNQQAFLHFLAFIVLFYTLAFIIYAASDFITWRLSFVSELRTMLNQKRENLEKDSTMFPPSEVEMLQRLEAKWNLLSTTTSAFRTVFEFIVPLIVAAYSVIGLLTY